MSTDAQLVRELVEARRVVDARLVEVREALAEMDQIIQTMTNEMARTRRDLDHAAAPQLMTVSAAARYLGISRTRVYQLLDDGLLKRHPTASGLRLLKSEVDIYVQGQAVAADGRLAS